MSPAQLVRLLREHPLAVASAVGPDGAPQSAVVGCLRPRWIRWRDFAQPPAFIFEAEADRLV